MSIETHSNRLNAVVPGGAHTYSRGNDQFPSNAPAILTRGMGAYVYDAEGKEYLDYGMGLRAVACGYAEAEIVNAALDGMLSGNCLTRPSVLELEAAELACSLLGFDMVKFTKNGSTATTAAVKLARAATGRSCVAFPDTQPFFSYDDWFIGKTKRNLGTDCTRSLQFGTMEELETICLSGVIACVILEPKDYDLTAVRAICDRKGIVLIFDEMITGFRYHGWSKADHEGVKPDLACFGKAMANGFSVACVGGKREIMEIGARRDMFLASTTHGAEMSGLAAFMATVKIMERHAVSRHLRDYKAELDGVLPDPMPEKTLFMQEMLKNGVMIPWVAPSYRHGEKELALTKRAVEASMDAIAHGATLEGPKIVPVFG